VSSRKRAASRASRVARSSGRHPEFLRDQRRFRHVAVAPGLVERTGAVTLVSAQEAVDLRDVHPLEQVGVIGPVRLSLRRRAAHAPVYRPHHRDGALGVVGRAERRHGEERAGALEPAPRVPAVPRVGGHRRHRRGVQRLQQERAKPADEHGGVAVHPPDRAVGREPPRPGRAVDPGAVARPVRPGDPREERVANPLTNLGHTCPGLRHVLRPSSTAPPHHRTTEPGRPRRGSRCPWSVYGPRSRDGWPKNSPVDRGATVRAAGQDQAISPSRSTKRPDAEPGFAVARPTMASVPSVTVCGPLWPLRSVAV
jgi:hypothetical protein